jgi:hypothetical protein
LKSKTTLTIDQQTQRAYAILLMFLVLIYRVKQRKPQVFALVSLWLQFNSKRKVKELFSIGDRVAEETYQQRFRRFQLSEFSREYQLKHKNQKQKTTK